MTCAVCMHFDICVQRNSLEACTHDDPERVREWALGIPYEKEPE